VIIAPVNTASRGGLMKKLINQPADVVAESLAGLGLAHADLVQVDHVAGTIVRRAAPVAGKVGLLSGGGSGHEPMHGGFVGRGMLDAACPGAVFTSPVPDQILAATRAVDGGAGVLYLVKNYSGDVMNFEIAAEIAAAEEIPVRTVVINDDVAVRDSLYTAGRRGVGGTLLVEKLAGALAEEGADLAAVTALAERVNSQVRSMGLALTSCTVPAAGQPTFTLNEDEMELGVGIHGEPGRARRALAPADEAARLLAEPVIDDLGLTRGDRVLAFVNGLGGTPLLELYIVYRALAALLDERGIAIGRSLVGSYVTSLEMAGCSITLLRLDDELTRLWDAPVHTPALRWGT
jgi:dihydroxyacetone kinase-like protein